MPGLVLHNGTPDFLETTVLYCLGATIPHNEVSQSQESRGHGLGNQHHAPVAQRAAEAAVMLGTLAMLPAAAPGALQREVPCRTGAVARCCLHAESNYKR